MKTLDDQKLVNLGQHGDRRAFEELVRRYQRKIFGIAFGIVRNPDDAMDVCQDTFCRAYKALGNFQGNSKFYTWLYRIAVNISLDLVNKRKRQAAIEHDDSRQVDEDGMDWRALKSDAGNPIAQLETKELGEAVTRCFERLSEKHRAVLILREVEGLSYEEIGEAIECNRGTVMSRLFHARQNMQRMLKAYLDGEDR